MDSLSKLRNRRVDKIPSQYTPPKGDNFRRVAIIRAGLTEKLAGVVRIAVLEA